MSLLKDLPVDVRYLDVADGHFRNMMAANAAEPYVHDDYDRHDRLARAALVLLTKGDQAYADALRAAFTDSNESMDYYVRGWSRDALVYDTRSYAPEDELPLQHRLGVHDSQDWQDSCPECAALVAAQAAVDADSDESDTDESDDGEEFHDEVNGDLAVPDGLDRRHHPNVGEPHEG